MDRISCGKCPESFDTMAELMRHECKSVGVDRYGNMIKECSNCGERYPISRNGNHIHECKDIEERKRKCAKCNLIYSIGTNGVDNHYCPSRERVCRNVTSDHIPKPLITDNPISPKHYKSSNAKCPCGKTIECISVSRTFNFNLGNVIKYIWRCDKKAIRIEQLKKAHWYLRDEIRQQEPDFDANL